MDKSKYTVVRKAISSNDSWSKDIYCNNYHDAYSSISKSDDSINMATVGGISIVCDEYENKRWIQWEVIGPYVFLHEIWLDNDLKDSSVCFKFDNENRDYEGPVAITISTNRKFNRAYNKYELNAILCVAMKNGFIYRINLDTNDDRISLLASSVHDNDGQVIDIYRERSLNYDNNKPPLTILSTQHKIVCGMWKGPSLIVFGLNGGDIVFVNIRQDNRIEETLLKDSVGLQALWSGIIGSRNENKEIVSIATDAHSTVNDGTDGYVLTISSTGAAKLWNVVTKQCMCQTELSPLISESGNDAGRVEKSVSKIVIDSKDDDTVHAVVGIDYHTGGHRSWHIIYMMFSVAGPNRAALVSVSYSDPDSHPIRPALLDLELDTSTTDCSLIVVWRSEEQVLVATSSSPLVPDEGNSFTLELVENISDDDRFRAILRSQLSQLPSFEERHRALNTCMIRKIFNSKQFTVDTIHDVLQYEIPIDFRGNYDASLDKLVGVVKDKCSEWATRRCDDADAAMNNSLDDYNETFIIELENVYFDLLTLCIRREGRLQSNLFSANGCLIQADKTSSSHSNILARRNGEAGILLKTVSVENTAVPPFNSILLIVKEHLRGVGDLKTFYHDLEAFFFNPLNFDDDEVNDQWISTCLSELCDSLRGVTKSMFTFGSSISRGSDASIKTWFDGFVHNAEVTTSINGVNSVYDFNFNIDSLQSSCGATLVAEIMRCHIIEKREIAIATAVILTLFAKGVFGPLSRGASTLMIEYVRKVKFSVVYTSYLLWMDAVRPCQTIDFIRLVDLQDTCPNSKVSPDMLALNCFNPRSTVWKSLWLACIYSVPPANDMMDEDDKTTLSDSFLKFLAPLSVTSILLQGGQFSCCEKLSSLMMTYNENLKVVDGGGDASVVRVANLLYASRLRTMKAFSALNSLLLWLKNSNINTINKTSVSEHLHRGVEALLAAANMSTTVASIERDVNSINEGAFVGTPAYDHVHAMDSSKQKLVDTPANRSNVILDAQDKVAALTATKHLPGNDIFSWPSLFLLFCKVSHLTDTAEFLRRIRILVPPSIAGNVILRANYTLVETIHDAILYFEPMPPNASPRLDEEPQVHATICQQVLSQLETDLQTGWCQIFEIALDSKYFDEALSAILKLIDIESSLSGAKSNGQRMYWQDCLSALVSRVCDVGRFGWLCSLPNIIHHKVNISELIAEELETLAIASSPFSSTISEDDLDQFDINIYYECLCAFLIRHRYFRDAAAIMYSFVRRIDNKDVKYVKHVSTRHVYLQQMRALTVVVNCLSVVPPQQAYILYPIQLTKRVSDIFTNSSSSSSPPKFGYLTLPHIDLMLAKVSGLAQVSDATDYSKPQPIDEIDISVLLREMCNKGYLSQAFSLVKLVSRNVSSKKIAIKSSSDGSYDNDMKSLTLDRKDLDYPIESLARYCSQELAVDSNTNPDVLEELRSVRRNLEIASTSGYGTQALANESNHVWDILLDVLKKLDDSSSNWSMHKRACETILNENSRRKLPESLMSSYCGFEFSKNEKKRITKYTGDPYSLLRLLIEYRHYVTASDILCQLILNLENDTESRFFHYNIFDNLIIAIDDEIDSNRRGQDQGSSSSSINTSSDLHQAKSRLEREMKKHFELMISNEY